MLGLGSRRHERELADALAASIDAVQYDAVSVADCLARFPHLASELEPLLRTSVQVSQLGMMEPADRARLRARGAFLSAAAARQQALVTPHPIVRRRAWVAFAPAALAAALFAVIAIPVAGSMDASAIPGDWNYGFKRATERVRLALTTDRDDRRMLRLEFASRRLSEIEKLSNNGQQIDGHTGQVTALLVEYTSEIKQVKNGLQTAPAVPDATKQQIESIAQKAATIVQPLANSAPADQPVKDIAEQAVIETNQTNETARAIAPATPKVTATSANRPPRGATVAIATASLTATSTTTPATVTPAPTETSSATPSPAASPTPVPSGTPAATATAAPTSTPSSIAALAITPPPTPVPTQPPAATRPVTAAPIIIATPARTPAPVDTAPADDSTPTPRPAAPVGTIGAPAFTATPVPTRTATPAPPPPTAVATRAVATVQPQLEMVTTSPGSIVYRYLGAPAPLDSVLPISASQVAVVYYPLPSGLSGAWYPGTPAPTIGPGTLLTVFLRSAPR